MIKIKFFKDFENYKAGGIYDLPEKEATRVFDSASCYNINEFEDHPRIPRTYKESGDDD